MGFNLLQPQFVPKLTRGSRWSDRPAFTPHTASGLLIGCLYWKYCCTYLVLCAPAFVKVSCRLKAKVAHPGAQGPLGALPGLGCSSGLWEFGHPGCERLALPCCCSFDRAHFLLFAESGSLHYATLCRKGMHVGYTCYVCMSVGHLSESVWDFGAGS